MKVGRAIAGATLVAGATIGTVYSAEVFTNPITHKTDQDAVACIQENPDSFQAQVDCQDHLVNEGRLIGLGSLGLMACGILGLAGSWAYEDSELYASRH